MKTRSTFFLLALIAIIFASCRTSKEGCAGAKYQGERFKTSKFYFYKN